MKQQNKKDEKLTDKAFSRLMITSVLGILICITCLCSATWAWFSADTSSGSNTLSSGKFDLDISLTDPNGAPVPLFEQESGVFTCTLEEAVAYTVTLNITGDTTATKGFCTIKVGGDSYQTASIYTEDTTPLVFTLDAAKSGITVTFSPTWGLPASEDVAHGGTLVIGAAK